MNASRATGEQQDRDVSTADGKKERNSAKEQRKRAADLFKKILVQSHHLETVMFAGEVIGALFGKLCDQRSERRISCGV